MIGCQLITTSAPMTGGDQPCALPARLHHGTDGKDAAAPLDTAPTEEKPLPEYLSIMPRSGCREAENF